MHVNDGILPTGVWMAGFAITGGLTWWSLQQIQRQPDYQSGIPKAALLTAVFFVTSSIRLPLPPTTLDIGLNGLLGALLGYYAFPAILIGLFFQAVMFGHGGITTLGINAVIYGLPALVAGAVFQLVKEKRNWLHRSGAFVAGAIGVGGRLLLFFGTVIIWLPPGIDRETELLLIYGLLIAHLPLLAIEGLFTALVLDFLRRVRPELLKN